MPCVNLEPVTESWKASHDFCISQYTNHTLIVDFIRLDERNAAAVEKVVYPRLLSMSIPSFPVFLNQFLHPRWCLAKFLPFNAGTNPLVSHHETRPLEPCAEIATAKAAMADEDPKGGGGSGFKSLLDDQEISEDCQCMLFFWCHDQRLIFFSRSK